MNSPVHTNLQRDVPFLIETGSDIYSYMHELMRDYPLHNIKLFDTSGNDSNIAALIPFGSIYPNREASNTGSNVNYFTVLKEMNSATAPSKWVLVDCNNIKLVGLCDLIFNIFSTLQDDFEVTIPSIQPDGNLCLIGFGETPIRATPTNDAVRKSMMAAHFMEKIVRIMMLCSKPDFELTSRELECIKWVAKGKTSNEIGAILSITESTVDKHVSAVCRKLNAVNRMQMIAKAVRLGVI
ncbi:helix-turn-helix transcriptional regulator [Lentilitoribacter sp. EG35]|uniref:helix-turn-helix transcriptional regulator n=1 Tax=Lentilitoribacter sp. EG35 TaxID=3234192 RepID=UPI00345F6EAC